AANASFDYRAGRLTIGGAIAYVGERRDTDFDVFPAQTVTLGDYVLASARIGYRVTEGVEIFARGTNLFNEEYQDVVGYATPGIAVFGGVRLGFGD
ncbi:MAG: TonB-dependent receptor, partial [Sphingomonadales bacterium]|nr:TonB-dependent receptor [Sphingomonadales bacterium]